MLSVALVRLAVMVSLMKALREAMSKPVGATGVSSLGTLGSVGSVGVSAARLVGDDGVLLATASERMVLAFLEVSDALTVESCTKESSSCWL